MAKVYLEDVKDLVAKSGQIREMLLTATHRLGNVHIGGPMSAADAVVAIYYKYLGFDPDHLDDPNRNMFILSKGHNGILLFSIFCDMGIYDFDLLLNTYNTIGNPFGAHPNHKRVKGIEVSTGSLGHGLSWCCGLAHANRNQGIKSRLFCLLGDGEMEEGSNWEAIQYAASKKMDNIVAVVDFNHHSAVFATNENLRWGDEGGAEGLANCYRAFGWNVVIADGTDMREIDRVLSELPEVTLDGKPNCIIFNTTKGQGVDFMQNHPNKWHVGGLTDEQYEAGVASLHEYTKQRLAEVE